MTDDVDFGVDLPPRYRDVDFTVSLPPWFSPPSDRGDDDD